MQHAFALPLLAAEVKMHGVNRCSVPLDEDESAAALKEGITAVEYVADVGTEADEDSVGGTEIQHEWTFAGFLANVPCDILD